MEKSEVLKVIDIESHQFNEWFLMWIEATITPTYRDQQLKDHIYNINDVLDELSDEDNEHKHNKVLNDTALEIQALILAEDAGYFRIIY